MIPVSHWGAHEVTAYDDKRAMLRTTASAIWRQPRLAVHFGVPVQLDDLQPGGLGDANRAAVRFMAAITPGLRPLRPHEPVSPRHCDPTRRVVVGGTAAFPGGQVPPRLQRAALDQRPPGWEGAHVRVLRCGEAL